MVTDKQFRELQDRFEELNAKYVQLSKAVASIQMKLDITRAQKSPKPSEPQKDVTRYSFNGQQYNKRQLVLACIKQYISDIGITDAESLFSVFPDFVQGSMGVIRKAESAEQYKDARNHYFFDDEDVLQIGNTFYVVSKDWTAKNIIKFIDVMETLGYSITPIARY